MKRFTGLIYASLVLLLLITLPVGAAAAEKSKVGVVILHGKTGQPGVFGSVAEGLKQAGFLVVAPEMPWSKDRYIDKTYEESLKEIEQAVDSLRKKGAAKVVLAGHSMGANASLAYAAYHGGIDGIILLAPGHNPDTRVGREMFAADVAKAKQLMDEGKGNQVIACTDYNEGKKFTRQMKAAIYYSFFNPEGMAAISKSASAIQGNIPVLHVAASRDPLTQVLSKSYLFDKIPAHPLSRYIIIEAEHLTAPAAAVSEMISWLNRLSE